MMFSGIPLFFSDVMNVCLNEWNVFLPSRSKLSCIPKNRSLNQRPAALP